MLVAASTTDPEAAASLDSSSHRSRAMNTCAQACDKAERQLVARKSFPHPQTTGGASDAIRNAPNQRSGNAVRW